MTTKAHPGTPNPQPHKPPPGPNPPPGPIKPPARDPRTDAQKLFAPFLRGLRDNKLAGIVLHGESLSTALSASPDQLGQTGLVIGRLGNLLPRDVLTAEDRPIYAQFQYEGQDNFVRQTASAMKRSGMVPTVEGTTPGVLLDLIERKDLYLAIKFLGDRVKDTALDLRLIYGSFQFFLIERVVTYLEKRLVDPYLTRQEMESLLDDFGPGLLKLDEVLRKGPDRKIQISGLRNTAQAAALDAQDEANLQEAIYQIHNDQTPDRAALLKAARRHLGQANQGTADGGTVTVSSGTNGQPPAPTQTRKMIR